MHPITLHKQPPAAGDWRHLSDIRQLLLLRVLRPDRLTHALSAYCGRVMGPAYTSQVQIAHGHIET